MKRLIFFLFIFIFSLLNLSKGDIFACEYDHTCDSNVYDCSNNIGSFEGSNKNGCSIFSQCQEPGSCCAEIAKLGLQQYTICYLKKGQPIPPPCIEGTEGCQCRSSPPLCDAGLNPISSGATCICSKSTSMPPSPHSASSPQLCPVGTNPEGGIMTALGCIPTKDTTQFVGWILGSAIKIAGGIAFLLIIFGAIKVLTSSGNPEAVKAGQEMITSALMGLLFIIFSLFLLELIGVKILQIPGFGQ